MKETEIAPRPTVFVVDDDQPVRDALTLLFQSVGLQARAFATADEFLKVKLPNAPCCLVLDVRLPGLSGLDFQSELAKSNIHIPIIFMTGHGDIPMTVKAMKAGAIEFLTKPFRDQELLDAVQMGLERARVEQEYDQTLAMVRSRLESLTPREQEVFALVSTGLMNKKIAAELNVSEITVKVHRGNVMRKMGAKSLAELVRMADALKLNAKR